MSSSRPEAGRTRSILAGAAIMLGLSMGMRQSLGLFLLPMTRDLGVTAADFTLAVAIQNAAWGLAQPVVGGIADRFGYRPSMVGGALLYAAATVIMLTTSGLDGLIVAGVLIGVALACTASSIAMASAARAVPEARRSAILGIVSAVGSLGTLLVAPLAQQLIGGLGWRAGLIFYVVLAAVMVPAAWLAGGSDRLPEGGGESATIRQVLGTAMRNRPFLVMSGAYFVCGLNLVFLTTHLPTYLSICGLDPMLGASALAVIGGFNIAGSYLFGWLGGRYPKHALLGILYILRSAVLTAYFIVPPTPATTLVFAASMGLLWLGVIPLTSGLVAELFGTRYMATLLGLSFMVHQAGSFLGAWGGGVLYTALGSYDRAWQFGVVVGLIAGLVQIAAGGPSRTPDVGAPALAIG
ncbi:MAG: MFS transporter [Alphaproteobacteria bacterium]|nr:MFS transporter [Alphaproteobacteria bacterium]